MLRTLLLSVVVAILVVAVSGALVRQHEGYVSLPNTCCADHQYYLAMAGGLPDHAQASRESPFAYRVLSPAIVRLLPFSARTGFRILTVTALTGSAMLLFLLLRSMGFDNVRAASGILVFGSLYWLVEFTQVDYALVDPLSFLLFAAVLLALYRQLAVAFTAGLLALAVANKESGLILVLVALVYLWRTRLLNRWTVSLVVGIPVITFLGLHVLIHAEGAYSPVDALREIMSSRYGSGGTALSDLRSYFIPTWGPMLLIVAAQPQNLLRFVRLYPELAVLFVGAHAQILFANDTSRLLVLAYTAVIPVVVFCLTAALHRRWLVFFAAAVVAVLQGLYFEFTRVSVAVFVTARPDFDLGMRDFEGRMMLAMSVLAVGLGLAALRPLLGQLHARQAAGGNAHSA